MSSSEIIASFIVRVPPEKSEAIARDLIKHKALEIHANEKGKVIITISATDESGLFEEYKSIKGTKGVISTELVFCGFVGDGPSRDMVKGDIPDWLNSEIDAGKIKYGGRLPRI